MYCQTFGLVHCFSGLPLLHFLPSPCSLHANSILPDPILPDSILPTSILPASINSTWNHHSMNFYSHKVFSSKINIETIVSRSTSYSKKPLSLLHATLISPLSPSSPLFVTFHNSITTSLPGCGGLQISLTPDITSNQLPATLPIIATWT